MENYWRVYSKICFQHIERIRPDGDKVESVYEYIANKQYEEFQEDPSKHLPKHLQKAKPKPKSKPKPKPKPSNNRRRLSEPKPKSKPIPNPNPDSPPDESPDDPEKPTDLSLGKPIPNKLPNTKKEVFDVDLNPDFSISAGPYGAKKLKKKKHTRKKKKKKSS